MTDIQDFHEDTAGRKWIPQRHSESHVYCRSSFHGHVKHAIFLIGEDGQFGPKIVKGFQDGQEAVRYLRDHSDSLTQDYVPSGTRSLLGDCNPCTEAEAAAAKAENTRRYMESKQKVINLKHGIKTDEQ